MYQGFQDQISGESRSFTALLPPLTVTPSWCSYHCASDRCLHAAFYSTRLNFGGEREYLCILQHLTLCVACKHSVLTKVMEHLKMFLFFFDSVKPN